MLRGVVAPRSRSTTRCASSTRRGAAVRLSHRYLADRQLPDKAVSVLDTACARVALGADATPPPSKTPAPRDRRPGRCSRACSSARRRRRDHAERLAIIATRREAAPRRAARRSSERWEKERLVDRDPEAAREARGSAGKPGDDEAGPRAPPTRDAAQRAPELDALQGETPLMRPCCVDAQIVGEVISGWTGIPVGKMMKDEIADVLEARTSILGERVIGQDHALEPSRSASARPRPASTIPTSRSASSCSWGRAASARPRPRWRSPTCSTAASRT
jgi:type VI secretion system protein VasG